MKTKGVYEETSSKFGFTDWELGLDEELVSLVKGMIRHGCEIATKEYDCFTWFAVDYLDNVEDPTAMVVELPLGPNDTDNPQWKYSLSEIVNTMIEDRKDGRGILDSDELPKLQKLRDGLQGLVDKLNEAISQNGVV